MKNIIVEINERGEVTLTVKGVRGRKCQDLSRAIEQALGEVTHDEPTWEMLLSEEQHLQLKKG